MGRSDVDGFICLPIDICSVWRLIPETTEDRSNATDFLRLFPFCLQHNAVLRQNGAGEAGGVHGESRRFSAGIIPTFSRTVCLPLDSLYPGLTMG